MVYRWFNNCKIISVYNGPEKYINSHISYKSYTGGLIYLESKYKKFLDMDKRTVNVIVVAKIKYLVHKFWLGFQ